MNPKQLLPPIATSLMCLSLVSACTTAQDKQQAEQVAALTDCEKIDALIDAHSNGFEQIKTYRLNNTALMDVWEAKYHLVGKDCQIVRWASNKYSYGCSISAPNESLAMQRYQSAKQKLTQCVKGQWVASERERHGKAGWVFHLRHPEVTPVITTQVFVADGLYKGEWTNYFFIGDEKLLKPES